MRVMRAGRGLRCLCGAWPGRTGAARLRVRIAGARRRAGVESAAVDPCVAHALRILFPVSFGFVPQRRRAAFSKRPPAFSRRYVEAMRIKTEFQEVWGRGAPLRVPFLFC